jgi:hypothetical protein
MILAIMATSMAGEKSEMNAAGEGDASGDGEGL